MNVFVIEMHSELAESPFNMGFFLRSIFDDTAARSSPKKPLTDHEWRHFKSFMGSVLKEGVLDT